MDTKVIDTDRRPAMEPVSASIVELPVYQPCCQLLHTSSGIDWPQVEGAVSGLDPDKLHAFTKAYNLVARSRAIVDQAREFLERGMCKELKNIPSILQELGKSIFEATRPIYNPFKITGQALETFLKTLNSYGLLLQEFGEVCEVLEVVASKPVRSPGSKPAFIAGVRIENATNVEFQTTLQEAIELSLQLTEERKPGQKFELSRTPSSEAHLQSILTYGLRSTKTLLRRGIEFSASCDDLSAGLGKPVCTTSDIGIPKADIERRATDMLGGFDVRSPRGVLLEASGEKCDELRLSGNIPEIERRLGRGVLILSQVDHQNRQDFEQDRAWFHGFDVSYPPGPMVSNLSPTRIFALIIPAKFRSEFTLLQKLHPHIRFEYVKDCKLGSYELNGKNTDPDFTSPDFEAGIRNCLISVYSGHGLRGMKGTVLSHMTRLPREWT